MVPMAAKGSPMREARRVATCIRRITLVVKGGLELTSPRIRTTGRESCDAIMPEKLTAVRLFRPDGTVTAPRTGGCIIRPCFIS